MRTLHQIKRSMLFAAIAALSAVSASAGAAYPEQAVKIIVGFPAGGATDVIARVLGAELSKIWDQTVVVENRTGAGGNIAAAYVAKANKDGYTLLMSSPAETVINPLLYPEMQYDAQKDLAPVSQAGSAPLLLVAHPSVPAKDARGLIDYIRKNSGKVSYASSGTGGPQHLAAELFKLMTNTKILHVPYKGGAPAITDLVGGQVQIFFAGLPPALPFVKSGKANALAVTTKSRSELAPEIPSLEESGLHGFDIQNWQGVFAPAGTPQTVINKISADIATALSSEAVRKTLAGQGISAAPSNPNDFKAFVDNERRKYADIIKAAHVSIN